MEKGHDIGGIEELGASPEKKGRKVGISIGIAMLIMIVIIAIAMAVIHFDGAATPHAVQQQGTPSPQEK